MATTTKTAAERAAETKAKQAAAAAEAKAKKEAAEKAAADKKAAAAAEAAAKKAAADKAKQDAADKAAADRAAAEKARQDAADKAAAERAAAEQARKDASAKAAAEKAAADQARKEAAEKSAAEKAAQAQAKKDEAAREAAERAAEQQAKRDAAAKEASDKKAAADAKKAADKKAKEDAAAKAAAEKAAAEQAKKEAEAKALVTTKVTKASELPGDVNALLEKNIALGSEWLDFSKQNYKATTEQLTALDTRINAWAEQAKTLSGDQLKLVQGLNQKTLGLADDFTRSQTATADWQLQQAKADRARYDDVYRPLEDQFARDAATFDSPERQQEAAAAAKADVLTASADARAAADRQAAALGIRPDSGRAAGINRSTDIATALASAGAQNTARETVRDKGLALRTTAIQMGQPLPGRAASEAASAISAQNSALNNQLSASNSAIANEAAARDAVTQVGQTEIGLKQGNENLKQGAVGIMGNGYGMLSNANNTKINTSMGKIQDDAAADAANMQGLWSAIGTGVGLLAGGTKPWILSSEELKEDKEPIPEGDALEAVENMPVEHWKYKEGVADEGEHVGPYAEDFAAETGRGDGTAIPMQDAIGITMKAVQDLSAKVDRIAAATGIVDPRKGPTKARGLNMRKAA